MNTEEQDIEKTGVEVSWQEANQRALAMALGQVRRLLEIRAGITPEQPEEPAPEPSANFVLERICLTFGLTSFERDVLLLCAGVELNSSFPALCAQAQGDPSRPYPTFSLALGAFPQSHWSALSPGRPLRYWRMIEIDPGPGLTQGRIRIDEYILHSLTGVPVVDERLVGLIDPLPVRLGYSGASGMLAPPILPPSHQAVVERFTASWSPQARLAWPVIQLIGSNATGKQAVAAAACSTLGLSLSILSAQSIPVNPAEIEAFTRLWEREALLSASALFLDCDELDRSDMARSYGTTRLIERLNSPLIVSSRERQRIRERPSLVLDLPRPSNHEQRLLWRSALGEAANLLDGNEEALFAQFNLSPDVIQAASNDALGQFQPQGRSALEQPEAVFGEILWEACRVQARTRLDELAQRIQGAYGWDDLVLPTAQRQVLGGIAAHVRQRARVYETWGFARKSERGLGISALFVGASGTGKTMAAEVLGNELRLDLYRIDLSQVVSKYIGETEKNLRRVFDAAEESGAILLFDEADALFGKRSEVKDSHDRYANIEVGYLLQRMEAYRGLAILTTNMKSALDNAFLRRIRFIVQFPFPDQTQRLEIWRRIFPAETPVEGLKYERLARLNIAGGNIRSIALNSAFLAADAGEPVRMSHLLHAARAEYAKLEKPLTEAEIAGWS